MALLHADELCTPQPGWFRRTVAADHLVAPGDPIGELEVLGRTLTVTAPRIRGLVQLAGETGAARRAVGYGDVLIRVVAAGAIAGADDTAEVAQTTAGLVFRAPTSGRYYSRSSPDKPPFVTAGAELAPGATVCLLEVMKTFNRVTYSGAPVRVTELLVADGADVNAGDPLLALEPA
ncbi:MAG TPA: biotin/lipoyl-containing protein [Kofleriaceae bacterium]|nr:biotin/lipoyl-containing protein [Kofleriaceae bacterium]